MIITHPSGSLCMPIHTRDPEKARRVTRARWTERTPETPRGPGWRGQPRRGNTARTDAGLRARARTGLGDCQSRGWPRRQRWRGELGGGLIGGRGTVNQAQIGGDGLAILPGAEVQRVAHEVDNAGLHGRVREGGGDGLASVAEPVPALNPSEFADGPDAAMCRYP